MSLVTCSERRRSRRTGATHPWIRVKSADLLRGATIAAMVLVNAQFSPEASYRQLVHADWTGWTFADTIYPCFLSS